MFTSTGGKHGGQEVGSLSSTSVESEFDGEILMLGYRTDHHAILFHSASYLSIREN
jgi:hypothetical protein